MADDAEPPDLSRGRGPAQKPPPLPSPPLDPAPLSESTRLGDLFKRLDLNQDGRIDSDELAAGLDNMGYCHISRDQIEQFLERSDATNSGDLSLQEFVSHLQRHEKQLHFVFSKLDTDQDGRVTSGEIKVAFKNLGISIGLEEAEKLVSRIDDDNSLDISYEEWRDYLMFHPSSNMKDIIDYWRQESYLTQLDHGEDVGTPGVYRVPAHNCVRLHTSHVVSVYSPAHSSHSPLSRSDKLYLVENICPRRQVVCSL